MQSRRSVLLGPFSDKIHLKNLFGVLYTSYLFGAESIQQVSIIKILHLGQPCYCRVWWVARMLQTCTSIYIGMHIPKLSIIQQFTLSMPQHEASIVRWTGLKALLQQEPQKSAWPP